MSTQMYCHICRESTDTELPNLKIVEKASKTGIMYYLQSVCKKCTKLKSRRLGKKMPTSYSLQSTSDELLPLLSTLSTHTKNAAIASGGHVEHERSIINNEVLPAIAMTATTNEDAEGAGIWDSIKNFGRKKTFADRLGDTASKATKSLVRGIPFVGDLLADTGFVDKGIDMFSEYVWQPIKKYFGGTLDASFLESLKHNDKALSELAEKFMDMRITSGDGIVPKYIGELRNGSEEDKALAHVLLKTVCKPKFYKFLKDESIPSSMSILEAMMKYKSRDKPYKNDEEKALQILSSLGYESI